MHGVKIKKYGQLNVIWFEIEERGLLKMDLLGLNTQDCISETLQLIERHHGIVLDINDIPFETDVFEHIYAKGHTNSVFQF